MAVQVERKPQQHPSRQKSAKQDSRSGSSSSLPVKASVARREVAGGQAHSNQRSGEPHGMRSMPPNATQCMMMQKQPAQAQQQSQQAPQANQSSQASSGAASQPASLKQQQQQQQTSTSSQLSGGQRAAFKISTNSATRAAPYASGKDEHRANEASSLPPAGSQAAGGQQQQQQPQAQQQLNTGSMALECSLATGPSTLGEPDDPSECSCSNSFDCLTDEGSQANFHRPPHGPPAQPQHYLHHNQQHPAPTHHFEHGYHNAPHNQHQLHHRQQNFHHRHPTPHLQPAHHQHRGRPQSDPFGPPAGSMAPQHPPPLQHHHHPHHHHPQPHHAHRQSGFYPQTMPPHVAVGGGGGNQHRPLLPHASMPPLQSRNYNGPAGPAYPTPPPLVRHSTYSATSETITDSPMQSMRQPNYTHPSSPTNHTSSHNATYPSDYYNPDNETDLLISNKSDTNFRRSATAREPEPNKWRPVSQQQMHGYSSEQTQYQDQLDSHLAGPAGGGSLQRHTATGRHSSAKSSALSNPQHQSRMSLGRRQNSLTNNSSKAAGRQALANDNTQHNSATTAFQYPNDPQQQQQHQQQHQQHQQQQQEQHQQSSAPNNTNSMHNTFQGQPGASSNLLNATPGGLMGAVSPFEAAATFCPPILSIPPAPLPIGPMAITSHRTNSPWMRLSSIILTPVGIVIAFFIVISPLLHYLM